MLFQITITILTIITQAIAQNTEEIIKIAVFPNFPFSECSKNEILPTFNGFELRFFERIISSLDLQI